MVISIKIIRWQICKTCYTWCCVCRIYTRHPPRNKLMGEPWSFIWTRSLTSSTSPLMECANPIMPQDAVSAKCNIVIVAIPYSKQVSCLIILRESWNYAKECFYKRACHVQCSPHENSSNVLIWGQSTICWYTYLGIATTFKGPTYSLFTIFQ